MCIRDSCWDDSPWRRAQFLAIRNAFVDEWQPRGGIELPLIDQMAQAHSLYLHWVERAHVQASLEGTKQKRELGEKGRWQPRTLGVAEALDQSAQNGRTMAEVVRSRATCAPRSSAARATRGPRGTGQSGER